MGANNSTILCNSDCRGKTLEAEVALKDCVKELPMGESPHSLNACLLDAARIGDASMVEAYLLEGADVKARQQMKLLPLQYDDSRTSSKPCGFSPLMLAAHNGHVRCIAALLKAGAKPNERDEDGKTALHLAAVSGDLQCLQILLSAGADPKAVTTEGDGVVDYLPSEVLQTPELLLQFTVALPEIFE
eukprot:TRINITY_DN28813_c0_g1_i1.p1 TRINITY_DN28813_c0_g1~~TRINITY_DN28813_c0_g1_i1.p1  ORF type:complete len:197 (+),score=50.24 TRINITY_DN28813_c0_g1_i1:29-592(+)